MEHRRKTMRSAGLVLALTTPISAFVSFALFSTIFGEQRFEADGGTTGLGYLVMAVPLAVGLSIAAWAHLGGPIPSRANTATTLAAIGGLCIALGILSATATNADASIGGGLLVLFGVATIIAAIGTWLAARNNPPPPPPTAPPHDR